MTTADSAVDAVHTVALVEPKHHDGKTILVVDDDAIVRDYVVNMMLRKGYVVIVAETGPIALVRAREHDGPVQLLVSDFQMPGMTGAELARRLTREHPETAVLIMSGHDRGEVALETAWAFIGKPFRQDDFYRAVSGALGRERQSRRATEPSEEDATSPTEAKA